VNSIISLQKAEKIFQQDQDKTIARFWTTLHYYLEQHLRVLLIAAWTRGLTSSCHGGRDAGRGS